MVNISFVILILLEPNALNEVF